MIITGMEAVVVCALLAASVLPVAGDVVLVKDGAARAVIALPSQAAEHETLAATELANAIREMSGATVATTVVDRAGVEAFAAARKKEGVVPVFIGANVADALRPDILAKGSVEGSFMLKVQDDRVSIAGLGEGALFGTYELLEQMGVRWFMPGRLGTVMPQATTVAVAVQSTVQIPSFVGRHFQMGAAAWQRRLRCGGPTFPACHGLPGVLYNEKTFQEHPAYFAEIDGKRVKRQLCVSNPDVLKLAIEATKAYFRQYPQATTKGMGPNDGSGFCECAECRKLDGGDWDPFSGEGATTDRYVWFFNQVLAGIRDEFPDKKVGFYVYHTYMRPPVKVKPDPRVTGALAPITLCRVHGPNNPVCAERQYYMWLAQEWGKLMPELWERGYWSNLACPGFPFIIVHRLREEIPFGKRAGIYGWRVETFEHWGTQAPSFYIAAKLMWNAQADVDALLADFAGKFFGPAAKPMGEYVRLMDETLRDADFHTGCSWDMPHLYPPAIRKQARALVDKGRRLAGKSGLYAERVRMIGETLDLLDGFVEMMDARTRVDLVAAQRALERLEAAGSKLLAYDPPMLSAPSYKSYLGRFFSACTKQGYARVTGGNELAAACADEWDFLIDPSEMGETLGYWRTDLRGGNWQRAKTSSLSISDQGLRYYKGLSWYRQTVDLPARFAGKRLFLWCGGVDEKAKVWINGKAIGVSPGSSLYPFEMDATDAVRPGPNAIVFCVANTIVDELGTGGIVAPVILYAPEAGKAAKLENEGELKSIFP